MTWIWWQADHNESPCAGFVWYSKRSFPQPGDVHPSPAKSISFFRVAPGCGEAPVLRRVECLDRPITSENFRWNTDYIRFIHRGRPGRIDSPLKQSGKHAPRRPSQVENIDTVCLICRISQKVISTASRFPIFNRLRIIFLKKICWFPSLFQNIRFCEVRIELFVRSRFIFFHAPY